VIRAASRHQRIQDQIQTTLGSSLSVVCTGIGGDTSGLWPEEEAAVAGAILNRRLEFAAGRSAAREAMRRLNGVEAPIPMNLDRSPCWPPGIVGSISHTSDTCLAVVGHQAEWLSIGIDMEPYQGIEESLWSMLCTPEELRHVYQGPPTQRETRVGELFAAKEAFYKWHYPQKKTLFEFQDVCVHWSLDRRAFTVSAHDGIHLKTMERLKGLLLTIEDHVIALCATSRAHAKRSAAA
jgi:4'-phosphopantetheinyl transferase EntD